MFVSWKALKPPTDVPKVHNKQQNSKTNMINNIRTRKPNYLPLQTLDQMADCHSGRDGVRIDDDVRSDSFTCEWHVLRTHQNTFTVILHLQIVYASSLLAIRRRLGHILCINLQPHASLNTREWGKTLEIAFRILTSCLYWIPHVPFCPCRLANLSPICGIRTERTFWKQNNSINL